MSPTGIQWTDETWNPTVGCSRVSPGCFNCYAEHAAAMVNRTQGAKSVYSDLLRVIDGDPRWNGTVRLIPERLATPLGWRKPRRIFVNSMSDLFHERLTNEEIAAVFGVMAASPQHTFQVLTKRAKRMREWFAWARSGAVDRIACHLDDVLEATGWTHAKRSPVNAAIGDTRWPLPNVWLGVSVENQDAADERIPELLDTPAAVHFISAEPLLGPVDLSAAGLALGVGLVDGSRWTGSKPILDWVIVGCESGDGSRLCDVMWLRSLRDQCFNAGVPLFLKQAIGEASTVHAAHPAPNDVIAVGPGSERKRGGVIGLPYLDGRQWAQFPEVPNDR